jgi:hypothetical protein
MSETHTRTSCGYPEICALAKLLDMTPGDPTKVVRAACEALTGKRETTLAQARDIMLKAIAAYEEHG